jgi:dTDP-4-amino-4,6-dideoxygalactose transaminase
LGAKPVFVDIEPTTFNIDVTKLADAITAKTKAIIPVHLFGQCVDMDPLLALARAHNLAVVEDAAQAIGSRYKDRYAGGMGTIGCFSFFPSKNLGGAGDGGLVTTNDANLHDKLTRLRVHGMEPKYYHALVGGNFRLDALQAAVLRVKLPYLDAWHEGRRRNAARYDALFEKHPAIVTPRILPACYSIYNQYVIRVPQRDKVLTALKQQNIGCEVYYPLALHTQQCFAFLGYAPGAFPEAERAARETLALPIYPELTEEQQRHVAAAVIAAIA